MPGGWQEPSDDGVLARSLELFDGDDRPWRVEYRIDMGLTVNPFASSTVPGLGAGEMAKSHAAGIAYVRCDISRLSWLGQ